MIGRETAAFDAFLSFWRLPLDGTAPEVSLLERDAEDPGLHSALVHLRGGDRPRLYHVGGVGRVYAKMRPIARPPDSLKVLAEVRTPDGAVCSYVLEDPDRRVVYVPFSPSEAIEAFLREEYVSPSAVGRRRLSMAAYYAVKRVAPRSALLAVRSHMAVQQMKKLGFPQWPLETSLDDLQRGMLQLLLRVSPRDELPFVWFWPHGRRAAVTLTHDVEGADGLDMVDRFVDLEAEHGMVSSFNIVPHKYEIPPGMRERIESARCEVGVHGWDHEGSIVATRRHFLANAERINRTAEEWRATGFRSPSTHRNPDWLQELQFEYDSSFPDTDPYEPQPGGCLSLFPFMMRSMVELPITMPQDHTVFRLLRQSDAAVWHEKASALIARHALVCVLTHPDTAPGYAGNDDVFPLYEELLQALADDATLWHALPRDIARWWRDRTQSSVAADRMGIEGPADESGTCAYARLQGDQLVFRLASTTGGPTEWT